VNEPLHLVVRIILYIVGISLVLLAVLIVLKGVGLLPTIPEYVAWALVLFALGAGIIGGLRNNRRQ